MSKVEKVISDEAVEAAAATYWNSHYRSSADPEWIDAASTATRADETEQVRYMMRQALEAAAPHLLADLAQKADECTTGDMDKYFIDQSDVGGWLRSMVNPYRSQA